MTFSFIKQWCQTQLDLCGKAAILKVRNKLGAVWELWPFDMNQFEGIEVEGNSPFAVPSGFTFRIDNKFLTFPTSDVIWLRYAHPRAGIWDGFSPIQAQAYITDIDYYLEVYERGFFKNSARVDFVIETEANLSEEEAQRLKDQWVLSYGGPERSHQPVVASGGLKIIPMSHTNEDFMFLELSNWPKDRILGCYRVPEGKLGLFGDINRANQKGIDIAFNEEAIKPRCKLWDDEFTKQLIWESSDKVEMLHDNPVPRDREMDLKELELRGGKVPINTPDELRNWWDGAGPVIGGDVILVNKNLIPITMVGDASVVGGGDTPANDDDKPGSDDTTPEYDPENDPGGDESDKAIGSVELSQLIAEKTALVLRPVTTMYDKALAHTRGWSNRKAREYAVESSSGLSGAVRQLYIDAVAEEWPVDEFQAELKVVFTNLIREALGRRIKYVSEHV